MGSSEKYQKYTPLEHILKRPDTYIGSVELSTDECWVLADDKTRMQKKSVTYVPGLYKIFDEILVNAIDQSSQDASVDKIAVTVNKETGCISVMNTGCGIPIEIHEKEQVYIPEMIFGELLTSSNYDDSQKRTVGGRNGYGAKLTNIFSKRFELEIIDTKNHKKYLQVWENNMKEKGAPKITKANNAKGYVKFNFFPDLEKFGITELTDDIVAMLEKRTYDACACTHGKVSVYYNDLKLNFKTFEKYVDLYIGSKKDTARVYDSNKRWEVCICHSPDGFKQISFVNGICTNDGGSHVESVVRNTISKLIENYKGKSTIKQNFVKDHLFVLVKATLENPAFSSQTKNECTSKYSSFGSRFEISEDFLKKVSKLGILEDAVALSKHKEQRELSKTDGRKKITIKGIAKLEDAIKAGGPDSEKCTIIFTEGDSAKTFAISGLSVVGRDHYGVFPLRGKLLNAREASVKQLLENEEISSIKQILGIQAGKEYTNIRDLRYGKIMILTDADHDGEHIKGLIMNALHFLCPSLVNFKSFFTAMLTPILKISKGARSQSFYTIQDFEKWKEANEVRGWVVKYYKGLGTSTSDEAKEYFRNLSENVVEYKWTPESEKDLLLAFKKENADLRKKWIVDGIQRNETIERSPVVSFSDFINKGLIHFSIADNDRSIPSLVDGLKPSQRKILFAMRKRKNSELKVSQLAGYCSSETSYHHGEQSMMSTIVSMAQTFVGSNNYALLNPNGGFGTRLLGGKDAASPRYIFTNLTEIANKIFKKDDDNVLTYLDDDGTSIEPEFFVPTEPLILINGSDGIGTGFSSNIPAYNPADLKKCILAILSGKQQPDLVPWYKNFTGSIVPNESGNGFTVTGSFNQIKENVIEVTELPVGYWTQDFKEHLESMIDVKINSYLNYSSDTQVRFVIKYFPDKITNIVKDFKLARTIRTSNMHLYDSTGNMKKYSSPHEILKEFVDIRLKYYTLRKDYLIKAMTRDLNILENKMRFINMIVTDELVVFRKVKKNIEKELKDLKFKTVDRSYNYLLDMKIHYLTEDKIKEFESDVKQLKAKVTTLEKQSNTDMWMNEL